MNPNHPTRSRALLGCFLLALTLCALLHRGTLDDLYITFTYARHLAEGQGFSIWNIHEPPVEGSTSTVWMVLLALGIKLGVAPFWSSFILSSLSFGGLVALFGLTAKMREQAEADVFAGAPKLMLQTAMLLTLTYVPLAWYGATGMETTFFAFLLAALLLSPVWAAGAHQLKWQGSLAILMVLTRPEGMLLGPLLCGYFYLSRPTRQIRHLLPLVASLAAVAGLTLFRILYFGDIFPNTYYAKAAGALDHHIYWGARSLVRFLTYNLPAWVIIAAGMYRAWKSRVISRFETFLCGVVLFYFLYMLKSGGDPESAFPLWRHFIHIAPIWLLLAACAIERLSMARNQRALVIATFILLTQATLSIKYVSNNLIGTPNFAQTDKDTAFFNYIQAISDTQTVAAAGYAGHWGWFFPGAVIDLWGLNNRHIAHFGTYQKFGELDSRSDMAYVFSQQPDLVNLDIDPADITGHTCPKVIIESGRSKSFRDALSVKQFRDDYYFVVNAPYLNFRKALFVHRRYLSSLQQRAPSTPELIRVTQTSLFTACPAQF